MSYLIEMFSVADASQMFWIIIILFIKYNIIENKKNEINKKRNNNNRYDPINTGISKVVRRNV